PVGTELKLTVQRSVGGQPKQIDLKCKTEKLESAFTDEKTIAACGITVRELTRSYLRGQRLVPADGKWLEGVLVTGVRATSAAEVAKLQENDIIISVDKKPIKAITDLEDAMKTWANGNKAIGIDIKRGRVDMTLVMKALEPA